MKEILVFTTYPPRKCGIASFSYDFISAFEKTSTTLQIKVCALESHQEIGLLYDSSVKYRMRTDIKQDYISIANTINSDKDVCLILLNHEYGLYDGCEAELLYFYSLIKKPIITLFHVIMPFESNLKNSQYYHKLLCGYSKKVIVMNKVSYNLIQQYNIEMSKVELIPHGTHSIEINCKDSIKRKYNFEKHIILSTFGLLAPNKNIETALEAISIIKNKYPNVLYLIIGQTHPTILSYYGDGYRDALKQQVELLSLSNNVIFIDKYLEIGDLLEYLQMTDIYLFTSSSPTQTVSGTLLYALSSGCPVIKTKIPCAIDLLQNYPDISFNYNNATELANCITEVYSNNSLQNEMISKGLEITNQTSWLKISEKYDSIFKDAIM